MFVKAETCVCTWCFSKVIIIDDFGWCRYGCNDYLLVLGEHHKDVEDDVLNRWHKKKFKEIMEIIGQW